MGISGSVGGHFFFFYSCARGLEGSGRDEKAMGPPKRIGQAVVENKVCVLVVGVFCTQHMAG